MTTANALLYNLACARLAALHDASSIALDESAREHIDHMVIDTAREVARLTPPTGELRNVLVLDDPAIPIGVCYFCRERRSDVEGKPCVSYLAPHEFRAAPTAPPTQTKRLDLNLCTKCKLHKKNPASATSDCEHTYPEAP